MHTAIQMLTSNKVRAAEVEHLIDHPSNAINMHYDPLVSIKLDLAWGVEARLANNEVRIIRLCSGSIADPDILLTVEILFPGCSAGFHSCDSVNQRWR